ncbi:rod shape-determining protein MreC [Rhodocyclus tenuis]|uniref:Cell shape-determining protein MreC n=2 Tax=Rhodocyclus TaxID=1064 RepID=A0A6L5JWU8_RHOTE|nr:rod shape-determining protein MreC [Rhodocyclus gracilis]MQY51833.1 rod shape-determining protein MreC [Rhodocyclus gracilis]MRD73478.1 rod shape-determining protein MreC [Rhodocyclus gracilis]NJA88412.1 rod shape-determining protein MreC [Rhodocyclus gracilis]
MDHQPPPFFKRGPAPLALLSFYLALSIALAVVDARFRTLEILRQGIGAVTQPLQQIAQAPARFLADAGERISTATSAQDDNDRLRRERLEMAPQLMRTQQMEAENARLRRLLGVSERQAGNAHVAEVIRTARDPFSRRIVIDKGLQDNVVAGQPVIDDAGIVGQVTRVFPFVSEVTLITDKDQAVPVQIVRNGLRSVVFGLGDGRLELRFIPANADVQEGDQLVTSGIDGIFLPGFPVATITRIERDSAYSFARIHCAPTAGVENFSEVMLLDERKTKPLPDELSERSDDDSRSTDRGSRLKKRRAGRD